MGKNNVYVYTPDMCIGILKLQSLGQAYTQPFLASYGIFPSPHRPTAYHKIAVCDA